MLEHRCVSTLAGPVIFEKLKSGFTHVCIGTSLVLKLYGVSANFTVFPPVLPRGA